jgi:hypothetical protein
MTPPSNRTHRGPPLSIARNWPREIAHAFQRTDAMRKCWSLNRPGMPPTLYMNNRYAQWSPSESLEVNVTPPLRRPHLCVWPPVPIPQKRRPFRHEVLGRPVPAFLHVPAQSPFWILQQETQSFSERQNVFSNRSITQVEDIRLFPKPKLTLNALLTCLMPSPQS